MIVGLHRDHGHIVGHRGRHDIGEVVLLLRVVVFQLGQPAPEPRRRHGKKAGVDLADRELRGSRVFLLDDARDAPRGIAHDAAVAGGIGNFRGEHRHAFARRFEHALERRRPHQRHIAIEHQEIGFLRHLRHRLQHRVASAELLGLQRPLQA